MELTCGRWTRSGGRKSSSARTTDFLQPFFQLVARIAAFGEDMKQPRPSVADGFQKIGSAVAILDIGTMHHEADHQPERIHDDVTLAAFGLLTGVKAPNAAAFSRFDALAVDSTSRRRGFF